jgi:site-specific DNA recombinase
MDASTCEVSQVVVVIDPPLQAKNGHILRTLFVVRVSNPAPGKQDIRSNDDQKAKNLEWLKARTDLPIELKVIAGSGSGEHLDRNEYIELLELVETGLWDLVVCEDLGRIVRRIQAHLFAELCVDHNTRLVSINDVVDTAVEG